MSGSDLVGAGWAFPPGVSSGGGIRLVTGNAEVDAAIRLILSTAPGERVMRPDFGCRMWEQVFAPLDANTLGLIESSVQEALGRWEPRIELDGVRAVPHHGEGLVSIEISYRIRATNDVRNLVHPFYVIPREAGSDAPREAAADALFSAPQEELAP